MGVAELVSDDPRHELIGAVDGVICDASEYEVQICLGIDVVELCSPDEAVDGGGTFTVSAYLSAPRIGS